MTGTQSFRIGEVAAATGISVDALRFYEREGLLRPMLRSPSGARRYGEDVLRRVRFIKQAQAVGLTLKDIRVLVDARQKTSRSACRKIRTILAERIEDLGRRVQEMQDFRTILVSHLQACDRALATQGTEECPTVDAIERGRVAEGVIR